MPSRAKVPRRRLGYDPRPAPSNAVLEVRPIIARRVVSSSPADARPSGVQSVTRSLRLATRRLLIRGQAASCFLSAQWPGASVRARGKIKLLANQY